MFASPFCSVRLLASLTMKYVLLLWEGTSWDKSHWQGRKNKNTKPWDLFNV